MMPLRAYFKPLNLTFKNPVLTSRGEMKFKHGYLIFITDGSITGIGEYGFIEGLSRDNLFNIEDVLLHVCDNINDWDSFYISIFLSHPAICFAIETALLDLKNGGRRVIFDNEFSRGERGIPINGLIWMGTKEFMREQLKRKSEEGFSCIKLKVGAIDFEDECGILESIREQYDDEKIELRLDANGAFSPKDVFQKLERLSRYKIHSIEQPIKPNQWSLMREIVDARIIDIALDEELIGITDENSMQELLSIIKPNYIILKPSLLGGFKKSESWIALAEKQNIVWWATSALESNIGLNAIAQWVYELNQTLVQGLGTGALYTNNISSPLEVKNGYLYYDSSKKWEELC
jgi:o-succinylbenzoate synthase